MPLFFPTGIPIMAGMTIKMGWIAAKRAMLMEGGPWGGGKGSGGSGGGGDSGGGGGDGRPPSPWNQPTGGGGRKPRRDPQGPAAMDQLFERLRGSFGGGGSGGGGFGGASARMIWPYVVLAFAVIWILFTSVHRIGPQEQGVVTVFGRYWSTMGPGVNFTFPAPISRVQKLDVQAIRTLPIGQGGNDNNLVLTGDQNIVDLAYSVRWKIKPGAAEQFLFQIAEPEKTISEVAESAMRAVLASFTLIQAIGPGRTDIEQRVAELMQAILDDYKAGVEIQGIAISQADPPAAVNDAFKEVTASQQEVESNLNDARTYAQQVTAKAQGDAASFDKVYEQYSLAPEVTRRRMYYDTMERVLSKVDKTIIEAPGVTPYLALPEVRKRAAPAAEGAAQP